MTNVLKEVEALLNDRNDSYGNALDMHTRIAELWSTYLDHELMPSDVATMMVLFKIARSTYGDNEKTADDLKDMIGYASFAAEFRAQEFDDEDEEELPFDPRLVGFDEDDIKNMPTVEQVFVRPSAEWQEDKGGPVDLGAGVSLDELPWEKMGYLSEGGIKVTGFDEPGGEGLVNVTPDPIKGAPFVTNFIMDECESKKLWSILNDLDHSSSRDEDEDDDCDCDLDDDYDDDYDDDEPAARVTSKRDPFRNFWDAFSGISDLSEQLVHGVEGETLKTSPKLTQNANQMPIFAAYFLRGEF